MVTKTRGPRRPPAGKGPRQRGTGTASRPKPRAKPPAAPVARRPASHLARLVVVSRNPGKVRELTALLAGAPFDVVGLDKYDRTPAPVEDGATFEANARKKAIHYSRLIRDQLVLADDSGLVVDALGGQPGVRSARLGGPAATDADRIRLILRKMERVPWERRSARFRCVIAIGFKGRVLATFEGEVAGRITFEPQGSGGFGYDPIFLYPEAERTFAEMLPGEKDQVSHRGQALERAVGWLREKAGVPRESPE